MWENTNLMPIDQDAPDLPAPLRDPVALRGVSVAQNKCIGGYFTELLQIISTMGMSACSCAALYYTHPDGRAFGALTHYDGTGESGEMLRVELNKVGLDNVEVRHACQVFLAFHPALWSMTAIANLRSLDEHFTSANLRQFKHNGAAGLDNTGFFFDPYLDPPRAKVKTKKKFHCVIL